MNVVSAIDERVSVRGFKEEPVARELIEHVLQAALKAPSASNQQPWNFIVVGGEPRERLVKALVSAYKERSTHYDPSRGKSIPPLYMERTKKLLKGIRPHLDTMNKKTVPFIEEGSCQFYGAPVSIIVTMDKAHPPSKLVDIGCAVENLVLAAHAKGLGTCIIALILMFESVIREHLTIADDMQIVLAIALGYPDPDLPVNTFRAPKETLDTVTKWVGFE